MQTLTSLVPFLLNTLLPWLLTVSAPALAWAFAKLAAFLHAKATEANASALQIKTFSALEQLDVLAGQVVSHLNADVKEKIAGFLADGTLSDAEKAELKSMAMAALTSEAGPQALGILKGLLGDLFETVVSGAIEKAVLNSNKAKLETVQSAGEAASKSVVTLSDASAVLSGAK